MFVCLSYRNGIKVSLAGMKSTSTEMPFFAAMNSPAVAHLAVQQTGEVSGLIPARWNEMFPAIER